MNQSQGSRITPLPEHEARELIQKCYLHGRKVKYAISFNHVLFGTVVGVGEKLVHRGGLDHGIAGRYMDFTKLRIAPHKGGREILLKINDGSVSPMSPFAGADAAWMTQSEMDKMARILIRISDLPETPFWEGDIVEIRDYVAKGGSQECSNRWLVRNIDYDYLGRGQIFCEGVNLWVDGQIRTNDSCKLPIEVFAVLAHGNLWKFGHGEQTSFASIEEEALFYESLGMSRKVIQSTSIPEAVEAGFLAVRKSEEWELQSAVGCVASGAGDEIKNRKGMTFVVIKYDDEEFGKRMRAHTLQKLRTLDLLEKA